jgi:cephalosporin hydroxylase
MLKKIFKNSKEAVKNDINQLVKKHYKDVYSTTLREWLIYHHKEIVFDKMRWMGTRILKNPMDLWIYQEILFNINPDIIVEIGSANGGSTLYLAHLCDIQKNGKVVSIDINRDNYKVSHERIINLTGDSLSENIIQEVSRLCSGKTVLVIHDADHTEESVYNNLIKYSGFVSKGSYFIVEDGIIDLFGSEDQIGGHSGPLHATLRFLEENKDFLIDEDCERYLLTYNPKGFLKRIK